MLSETIRTNNTLEYKGYIGSVEFSEQDRIFYGKVKGIHASISYEGTSIKELSEDFRESIESYLVLCEAEGIEPEKPSCVSD